MNKFNFIKDIIKTIQNFNSKSKTYVIFSGIKILFNVIQNLLLVYLVKIIIDIVTKESFLSKILTKLGLIILIFMFIEFVIQICNYIKNIEFEFIVDETQGDISAKASKIPFSLLETTEIMDTISKAKSVISNLGWRVSDPISNLFINLFTMLGSVGIIFSLVKSNLYILIILVIITAYINTIFSSKLEKANYKMWDFFTPLNRKFGYILGLVFGFKSSKDFKLYKSGEVILKMQDEMNDDVKKELTKTLFFQGKIGLYTLGISQVQNILIYIFAIYEFKNNHIDIGNLLALIAAVTSISASLNGMIGNTVMMSYVSEYFKVWDNFMNLEEEKNDETAEKFNLSENFSIEFKNVSFKYKNSEKFAVKNINFKINSDEVISIVGHNGAGKTTFAKLLLGIYEPTQGEILINNKNIKNYKKESYYNIFAPVFQDFSIYPLSIKKNIALSENIDEEKIIKTLKEIGLGNFLEKYNNNLDILLTKALDVNGIDLSGGEGQKISIARAMYSDRNFLLLDEPTAALDPLVEKEIFENLYKIIKNKTAIFITHRMASCQNANKIVVFDNGEIKEIGTHKELLNKNGLYAKMFETQAKHFS